MQKNVIMQKNIHVTRFITGGIEIMRIARLNQVVTSPTSQMNFGNVNPKIFAKAPADLEIISRFGSGILNTYRGMENLEREISEAQKNPGAKDLKPLIEMRDLLKGRFERMLENNAAETAKIETSVN